MAERPDIVGDWQDAMLSAVNALRGAAGSDLPKSLLTPMQKQVELIQEVVERERDLQGQIFGYMLDPIDAVFDLLEQSGETFRAQAHALEEASAALERTAKLMQRQAEIYDGTVKALREPASVARKLAGAKARKPDASGGSKKKSGGKPKS